MKEWRSGRGNEEKGYRNTSKEMFNIKKEEEEGEKEGQMEGKKRD